LVASKQGGDDLPLTPQYAEVFGNNSKLISIRFTRSVNGRVTGFVLNTSRIKGLSFRKL